jgi:hypothetical protein
VLQDTLDRPLTSDYGVWGGTFRNERMDARRRGLNAADLLAELEGYGAEDARADSRVLHPRCDLLAEAGMRLCPRHRDELRMELDLLPRLAARSAATSHA